MIEDVRRGLEDILSKNNVSKNNVSKEIVLEEELMSKHTTFRIGGPASLYITPEQDQVADIVKLCRQFGVPFFIIGNGSNLLVSDQGIRGVVIEIGQNMKDIRLMGNQMIAQAGASLAAIARAAAQESLSGLEFASGIPGFLGGGLYMNAGAYGGELSQVVTKVHCLTPQGEQISLTKEELDFGYRHSVFQDKKCIILSAELQLESGDKEQIVQTMKELNAQRMEKQPLEYPSAGSTFKRPLGHFAGKLIQDAGLAGYSVGDAEISKKHCGFVINKGKATANDVRQLMSEVSDIVREKFGVNLEAEVQMLGEW